MTLPYSFDGAGFGLNWNTCIHKRVQTPPLFPTTPHAACFLFLPPPDYPTHFLCVASVASQSEVSGPLGV